METLVHRVVRILSLISSISVFVFSASGAFSSSKKELSCRKVGKMTARKVAGGHTDPPVSSLEIPLSARFFAFMSRSNFFC